MVEEEAALGPSQSQSEGGKAGPHRPLPPFAAATGDDEAGKAGLLWGKERRERGAKAGMR